MRDMHISRTVKFTAVATMAAALAIGAGTSVLAQPVDPAAQQQYDVQQQQYQQQQDDYQAQRDAYARQRAGYAERKDNYEAQQANYAAARAAYDARYGDGAYDAYMRTHTTTTTTYSPAGDVEGRSTTTVIESPGR